MNILDENILFSQRDQLQSWKVHFRQIGMEIGRSGMKDRNDIIPLLHTLQRPTFLSCDHGFYHAQLRHAGYCLVWLDVLDDEAAEYIRRLLRLQAFRTQAPNAWAKSYVSVTAA
ncbi:MAG: hypothetical protein HY267_02235 [Deltaproteobacteria bacterium]|nr:hypothetical protein [Deltaproteobacteria bacterium]